MFSCEIPTVKAKWHCVATGQYIVPGVISIDVNLPAHVYSDEMLSFCSLSTWPREPLFLVVFLLFCVIL